jgi:hypothetical protein
MAYSHLVKMDFESVGDLIGLRYKLLWARMRSRNGRIAIFMLGYLIFVLVMLLLGTGGFGAGIIAVRSGKALTVARIVLGSLYVEMILLTVIVGWGLNAVFSDLEIRRYPVGAIERRITRHLVALVDPFWFLGLAMDVGLAFGLYIMGVGSFGIGLIAVVLLFISNYLAARVVGVFVDRLMQHKIGSLVLLASIIGMAVSAGQIPVMMKHNPAVAAEAVSVLRFTPPFGAAAAITGSSSQAGWGVAIVVNWLVVLAGALVALERRPAQRQKLPTTAISFESIYDRIGARFGAERAPLVSHWLRFYTRNNRFRTLALLALPVLAFITYSFSFGRPRGNLDALFIAALGTFPLAGFMAPARFAVNQFGYVSGGYRRYFLLPTDAAAALRTGSYASMLLGAPLIVLAAIAWVVFSPRPFDGRMLLMLAASGIAGLLTFHSLGLWTSILGPRRGNYNQSLGNDLSLAGNIVFIGGMFVCLLTPHLLAKVAPALVSPHDWWIAVIPAAFALLFYVYSLRATGTLFLRRREQLMVVVEGRG